MKDVIIAEDLNDIRDAIILLLDTFAEFVYVWGLSHSEQIYLSDSKMSAEKLINLSSELKEKRKKLKKH